MTILGLSLLFAGAALAHSEVKSIIVDGTAYVFTTMEWQKTVSDQLAEQLSAI
jgi:hypothetical protein